MQYMLDRITEWTLDLKMEINPLKSVVLVIDLSIRNSFSNQEFKINNVVILIVDSSKLLGVMINNNVKWTQHVDVIIKKASKKIYMLIKLRQYGFTVTELVSVYRTYIRSQIEYAIPTWGFSLIQADANRIRKIEMRCLSIILKCKVHSENYCIITSKLKLKPILDRIAQLGLKLGTTMYKSPRFRHIINPSIKLYNNTRSKNHFRSILCKRERYRKSVIPAITRELNNLDQAQINKLDSIYDSLLALSTNC